MKFAEHLGAHITPEWRKQYIQYEEMKALLYACMEQAPSEEVEDAEAIKQHFGKFEEKFFKYCDKELLKINTFFAEKLAEANRRFSGLKSDLVNIRKDQEAKTGVRRYLPRSKQSDLKLAFSEFYLSLILLQNYQNLNFTGFRKILKKHDKLLRTDAGAKWREDYVETAPFNTNKDINKLISETEGLVTRELEDGDRGKAMKRLRVPPLGEKQSPWTTFKLGLFMGSFCVLSVVLAVSAVFVEGHDNWRIPVRLYRGPLMIIITTFLLGINIYGWRRAGVNHVLIFELDPRKHMSDQQLMEVAAFFGVLWTLSALLFVYSPELSMPKYCHPLILACCMLLFLLNPLKICLFEARMWFLRIMARIIAAPFCHVNFADFWLADQLNSLVPALLDIEYMICFYSTNHDWTAVTDGSKSCIDKEFIFRRPLIAILPAWFRFAQCLRRYRDTKKAFPHLVNAGKYSTTFFVVFFSTLNIRHQDSYERIWENPYFFMWIIASVVSSCYTYTWDIRMDWGLLEKGPGGTRSEYKYLREEIVYDKPTYYYFAIVEDFVLRFGWAISLSLTEMGYIHGDLMVTILAPLEVFRRFNWNFFRLENEHLNNCGQFRAVRDISIKPIQDSDQALMLRMMDDEDGVQIRRRKGKNRPWGKSFVARALTGTKQNMGLLAQSSNEGAGGGQGNDNDVYATVSSVNSMKQWISNFGTTVKGNPKDL